MRPNLPVKRVDGKLWGRGTTDMKGGVAVALALAAELDAPAQDVTWVFYDNEEVAADLNGLGRLARNRPDLLEALGAAIDSDVNAVSSDGHLRLRVPEAAAGAAAPAPGGAL